ncbi:hypothetical protein O6H91_14G031500 [Diphasiastrum complanatum]|nr:hypothetical protein O6H91_14G031500 [Diphasiastrum complanatum]
MVFLRSHRSRGGVISSMSGQNGEEGSLQVGKSEFTEAGMRGACADLRMTSSENVDYVGVSISSNGQNLQKCESSVGISEPEWHEQIQFVVREADSRMISDVNSSHFKNGLAVAETPSRNASQNFLSSREGTLNGVSKFAFSDYSTHISDKLALNLMSASLYLKNDYKVNKQLSSRSTPLKRSTVSSRPQRSKTWIKASQPGNELKVTCFSSEQLSDVSEQAFISSEGQEGRIQIPRELFQEFHSDASKQNIYNVEVRERAAPKDIYNLNHKSFGAITVSVLQMVPEEEHTLKKMDAECSTTPSNFEDSRLRRSPYTLRSRNPQFASDSQCVTSEYEHSSVSRPSYVEGVGYPHSKKQRLRKSGDKAVTLEVGLRARKNRTFFPPRNIDKTKGEKLPDRAHVTCDMRQSEKDSIFYHGLSSLSELIEDIPTEQRCQNKIPAVRIVTTRSNGKRQTRLGDKVPDSLRQNICAEKWTSKSSALCLEHANESVGSIICPEYKGSDCYILERFMNQDSPVLTSKAWSKESRFRARGSRRKQKSADAATFLDTTKDFLLSRLKKQQMECFSCKGSLSSEEMVLCVHKDCQNQYHRPCAVRLRGSIWHRNGQFVCPQHVCFACNNNHKGRLWRCQRCSTAVHENCSPWPDEMFFFDDKRGWAICWQHDSNWRQEKQHRQPTNDIQEAFRRLPIPYAPEEFRITTQLRKEVMENDSEPPPYAPIRRNVFLIRKRRDDFDDGVGCTCDSNGSGCADDCECRVQSMSCSKSCKCEKICANKPFRKEKRLRVVKTDLCGWGAEACEVIKKGDFVIEYVGEVINDAMCEKRLWAMKGRSIRNFYMCEIGKDFIIDATFKGNSSRYLNHSCEPNCKLEK